LARFGRGLPARNSVGISCTRATRFFATGCPPCHELACDEIPLNYQATAFRRSNT
jgi:hypothetical protein